MTVPPYSEGSRLTSDADKWQNSSCLCQLVASPLLGCLSLPDIVFVFPAIVVCLPDRGLDTVHHTRVNRLIVLVRIMGFRVTGESGCLAQPVSSSAYRSETSASALKFDTYRVVGKMCVAIVAVVPVDTSDFRRNGEERWNEMPRLGLNCTTTYANFWLGSKANQPGSKLGQVSGHAAPGHGTGPTGLSWEAAV